MFNHSNVIISSLDVILLTCFWDIDVLAYIDGRLSAPFLDDLVDWVQNGMTHTYSAALFATIYYSSIQIVFLFSVAISDAQPK